MSKQARSAQVTSQDSELHDELHEAPVARPGKRYLKREFSVAAEALDANAEGICSDPLAPELRIHVQGLLPGEHAIVKLLHISANPTPENPAQWNAWGRVLKRLDAAPERVVPACAGYGNCGGCTLQHLQYSAQLRVKTQQLELALRETCGPIPLSISSCVGAPQPLGYRSRVKLVFGSDAAGRLRLGSYAPRSHELCDMAGCKVNLPSLTALAGSVLAVAQKLALSAHDEARGTGTLRYLLLRETASGDQQLGLVVANLSPFTEPVCNQLVAEFLAAHPRLCSIVLHHNATRGNALLSEFDGPETDRVLHGQLYVWEELGPISLQVSARSFLQVNRQIATRIYGDVASFAAEISDDVSVLDLYCGVGGLGLTVLSRLRAARLYGVEENPSAIADAQASAEAAGFSERAHFQCGDVAKLLPTLPTANSEVALLNPPRRGVAPDVLAALLLRAPSRIIYVSCNPSSLARDLNILFQDRYVLRHIAPYDMHPGTPHIETVAVLDKKD